MNKLLRKSVIFGIIASVAMLLLSCGSAEQTKTLPVPDGSPSTAPAPVTSPKSTFERDMDFIRKGRFTYVWVFSRKDGKPIDKDDGAYLRKNAPQVVDWVSTDEGRRVIAGTNFNLEEGNLDLLRKRFVIEDYSGK